MTVMGKGAIVGAIAGAVLGGGIASMATQGDEGLQGTERAELIAVGGLAGALNGAIIGFLGGAVYQLANKANK